MTVAIASPLSFPSDTFTVNVNVPFSLGVYVTLPVTASTVASPLIGFVSIVYVNLSPLSESNATMSPDATTPNFVYNTKSSACGALFPTSTTMSSLDVVSPSSTKSYLISPSNLSPKLFPALSFTDTANLYFPYLVGVSTT